MNPRPLSKSEMCASLLRLPSRRQQLRQIHLLDSQEALELWVVAQHEERMAAARADNAVLKILLQAYGAKSVLKIAA